MTTDDPRIRVSWGQVVWFVSILVAVLGTWADQKVQWARIDERLTQLSLRVTALEAINQMSTFTREDAGRLKGDLEDAIRRSGGTK